MGSDFRSAPGWCQFRLATEFVVGKRLLHCCQVQAQNACHVATENSTLHLIGKGWEAVVVDQILRHLQLHEGFEEGTWMHGNASGRPDDALDTSPEQERSDELGKLARRVG